MLCIHLCKYSAVLKIGTITEILGLFILNSPTPVYHSRNLNISTILLLTYSRKENT